MLFRLVVFTDVPADVGFLARLLVEVVFACVAGATVLVERDGAFFVTVFLAGARFAVTFFTGDFLSDAGLVADFATAAFFAGARLVATFFAGARLVATFFVVALFVATFFAGDFLRDAGFATAFLAGAFLAGAFLRDTGLAALLATAELFAVAAVGSLTKTCFANVCVAAFAWLTPDTKVGTAKAVTNAMIKPPLRFRVCFTASALPLSVVG